MTAKHTPGPWAFLVDGFISAKDGGRVADPSPWSPLHKQRSDEEIAANARLIAAAPELLEALEEGRRAIGDHHAPNDCYATGPVTGDAFRDLVECPACAFIAKYDAAIAKATGGPA